MIIPKKRRQTICIHCLIHENQERFPYITSKEIEGVLDDKNAKKLTVRDLELGKKKVSFERMLKSIKRILIRNIKVCENQKRIILRFFQNNVYVKEEDYNTGFEVFKFEAFKA